MSKAWQERYDVEYDTLMNETLVTADDMAEEEKRRKQTTRVVEKMKKRKDRFELWQQTIQSRREELTKRWSDLEARRKAALLGGVTQEVAGVTPRPTEDMTAPLESYEAASAETVEVS
ncbi:uncharacterized protein LOC135492935 [Lineus longissimus]|uniref:uncharacterized protein LOC135492935 n=1 Tax=Lineus longissimus TaxID=88925 RepID=UPI002B4ED271